MLIRTFYLNLALKMELLPNIKLTKKMIAQFKEELKEKINEGMYSSSILKDIEEAEEQSINMDDIPDDLGKIHTNSIHTYKNQ